MQGCEGCRDAGMRGFLFFPTSALALYRGFTKPRHRRDAYPVGRRSPVRASRVAAVSRSGFERGREGCRDARDAGMQGCRDAGMQGCRDAGMQGCRDAGMQGCRDAGIGHLSATLLAPCRPGAGGVEAEPRYIPCVPPSSSSLPPPSRGTRGTRGARGTRGTRGAQGCRDVGM